MSKLRWLQIVATTVLCTGSAANAASIRAYVANIVDDTVSVIDTGTQAVIATIPVPAEPRGVAALSDGSKVYVASQTGFISSVDTATNMVVASIPAGVTPYGIAASPDGQRVYVTDRDDPKILIVDATTDVLLGSIPRGRVGIVVLPDGTAFYAANGTFLVDPVEPVSVISAATNLLITEVPVGTSPYGLAALADSTLVFVTNENSANVSVIERTSHSVVTTVATGLYPRGIAALPDKSKVYVANLGSDSVSVIDVPSLSVVATIPVGSQPYGVSAAPDSTRVYVPNAADGTVSVIDTATEAVIATIPVGNGPASAGNFVAAVPVCGDGELDNGEQCDDGNVLDGDCCSSSCDRPTGCLDGFGRSLVLFDERTPGREKVVVKLSKGPSFERADLGNPLSAGGTSYRLCVWDDTAGSLVGSYDLDRAGAVCGQPTRDCWKPIGGTPPSGKGYKYKDRDAGADGLNSAVVKAGVVGRSKLIIKGKGANLPLVASTLVTSTAMTVQFHGDAAKCLEARLTNMTKQSASFFRAK